MAQDRKVFVGGVPQDLTQEDLYAIFSEYAGVKKAWLQKCRNADESNHSCPPQSHRGFGFVIFHDAAAIDELLGHASSRFVLLRNGTKLEVKRALSSNKMGWAQQTGEGDVVPQGQSSQEDLVLGGSLQRVVDAAPGGPAALAAGDPPGNMGHRATHRGVRGGRASQAGQVAPQSLAGAGHLQQVLSDDALAQGNAAGVLQHQGGLGPLGLGCLMAAAPGAYSRPPVPCCAGIPQRLQPAHQAGEQPALDGQAAGGHAAGAAGLHTPTATAQPPQGLQQDALRQAVVRFYKEHKPEKLSERDFLDFICSMYDGREAELDHALRTKYGDGLSGVQLHGSGCGAGGGASGRLQSPAQPKVARTGSGGAAAEPSYVRLPAQTAPCSLPPPTSLLAPWGPGALLVAAASTVPAHGLANGAGAVFGACGGIAGASTHGAGDALAALRATGAAGAADVPLEELEFVGSEPDLDQIAADFGVDVSDEVARAIISRSGTLQRKDWLQRIVW